MNAARSTMQETAAAVTSGPQCLGHSCPYQSLPSSVSPWAGLLQPVFWFFFSLFFLFCSVPWTLRQMTQMSPLGRSMQQSLTLSSLSSYESMQSPLLAVKWGFADKGWEHQHSPMNIICKERKKAVCCETANAGSPPRTCDYPKQMSRFIVPGENLLCAAGITSYQKASGLLCSHGTIIRERSSCMLAQYYCLRES